MKLTAKPERPGQLKAFVTVMEGCEKFCTFCVVPVTRGRERSHAAGAIVAEMRGAGGRRRARGDAARADRQRLWTRPDASRPTSRRCSSASNEIEGIERIRFTTSNPYNLTSRLIRAIRDLPKVVEYLHLPLQSGSDRMLERMNRGYTAARYLELIDELVGDGARHRALDRSHRRVSRRDGRGLRGTVDVVERVRYDNVFAFRYSRRPGHAGAGHGRSGARRGQGAAERAPPRGRRRASAPSAAGRSRAA